MQYFQKNSLHFYHDKSAKGLATLNLSDHFFLTTKLDINIIAIICKS